MNRAQRRKLGTKTSKLETVIGTRDGHVVVEFPEKIKWFSMPPAEMRGFILQIEDKIKLLEGEK